MPINLNDLDKLKLEASGDQRAAIAQKIASGYLDGEFHENEKRIAIEIFRLLLGDAEVQVRRILSENLAQSMDVPRDIVLRLAKDITEVALPMLQQSYVLTEDDLISITRSTEDAVVMSAIARRDMVSRELSAALLQKSNVTVMEALLSNKSASLDEKSLDTIYSQYGNNDSLLELMVKRGGLPMTLAEKLFVAVSDELKKVLTRQYKLSLQIADDTTKDARELATLGLVDSDVRTLDIANLIEQLYQKGRLTMSIILRSLCLGDMRFFEHAMAKLADIPVTNAQLLVLDQGSVGFGSLYKSSCLPMELYNATRHLLKIVLEETSFGRFQRTDFKKRLSERLMRDEGARDIEHMDYLVTLVHNNVRDVALAQ